MATALDFDVPAETRRLVNAFWRRNPSLREYAASKQGDPIGAFNRYWQMESHVPDHADVFRAARAQGSFTPDLARKWMEEELSEQEVEKGGVPAWANYRPADSAVRSCGTCVFFDEPDCTMFSARVRADYTCDEWDGSVDKEDTARDMAMQAHHRLSDGDKRMIQEAHHALEPVGKADGALFLVSHAKTRYNRPGQPHDIVQGWRNVPLDSQGRRQAAKLGKWLKDQNVTKVYASDLSRAKQTAMIAGRQADVPVQTSRRYRPWNLGSFAGHSSADVLPKLKPYMDNPSKPVDGGESFGDYKARFIPALEALLKRAENGERIALVTHSRNIELAQGWIGGKGYRSRIDTKAIEEDKIDPAVVIPVTREDGKMTCGDVEEIAKAQAYPAQFNLRVHGVSQTPEGMRVYRMVTRDGHYVGRTQPTKVRARKGETLTLRAAHFATDPQGDPYWLNPVVQGQSPDAAHSWRELEALAGRQLLKDFAPGPAGDAPPPGDASNMAGLMDSAIAAGPAEGPTLGEVHVDAPLKNISTSYAVAGKKKKKMLTLEPVEAMLQVHKADKMRQILYGVVLEPHVIDTQNDYMRPEDVEKAAHGYLKKVARSQASVSKLQHRAQGFFKTKPGVVPVESFIAPCDFTYDGKEMVTKGTWVMAVHVEDPKVWQDVLDGKYTGFSVGGSGVRQDMQPPVAGQWMEGQPADWHPAAPLTG